MTKLIVFKTPLSADYVPYCPGSNLYKLVHIYVIAETNRVDFSFAKVDFLLVIQSYSLVKVCHWY